MAVRYHMLLLWLAALLLSGWWALTHISMRTDLSLFLPQGTAPEQRLLLDELNQGPANRLLMLGIRGGDPSGRAAISQKLAAQLRESPLFEQLENGAPGEFEIDRTLFQYRYLIAPGINADDFSPKGLHTALQQRLEELQSPFPSPFKDLLAADPAGIYQSLLQNWLPHHEIANKQGVWSSREGDTALLLARTKAGGLEIDQQQQVLTHLRTVFNRLDAGQGYELVLSGPGAFGVQSRNIIRGESRTLSMIASTVIALLLFIAYRYLPYLLISALPLLSALIAAAIACQLIFNELHGITLAFGITLLGVTLDYPIHLFSHLRKQGHVKQAMTGIWGTLRLGVITTCVGYLVLVTTDFTGLRQLGLFTLTGLLTAAATSRYLLPQLFPVPFQAPSPRGLGPLSTLLGKRRWPSVVVLFASAISLLALITKTTPIWQDDIATLSPIPEELLQLDRELRTQLGGSEPNHLLVIRGDTPEALLQTSEAVRSHLRNDPEGFFLSGIELPSDYLPSQQQQLANQKALPDGDRLSKNLRQALQGTPFRAGAFDPFTTSMGESRTLPPLSYEAALETVLKPRLESLIREDPNGWLALIPLRDNGDPDHIANYLETRLPEVEYMNLRRETSQLVGEFRQQILQRVALGSLLMLLLLWFGLRSLRNALTTLFPIALAILTTVGAIQLSGETLNLFHLISLMLVLGIGIDYSLFFGRRESQADDNLKTLHALSICALSTTGVFAILASSSIPVLHAIGLTVAIGVAMSYLATYALSRGIS